MERTEFGKRRKVWWALLLLLVIAVGWLYSIGVIPLLASRGTVIALLLLSVAVGSVLFVRRSRLAMPPYTINDDILYVHYGFGEVEEYPISNFGGKIEVISFMFSSYLVAPGYPRHFGRIPLSLIDSKERERLLNILRRMVANA